jgi:hypothetical protein
MTHLPSFLLRLAALLLLPFTACAENIDLRWKVQPYEPQSAKVGDTITFNWSGTHNVYIHPTETCDSAGSTVVGVSSGALYTFTSEDVGAVVFACDVSSHCEDGQIVTFNVAANDGAPTSAPASAAALNASGLGVPLLLSVCLLLSFQLV